MSSNPKTGALVRQAGFLRVALRYAVIAKPAKSIYIHSNSTVSIQ
jgi:hypothetical protein